VYMSGITGPRRAGDGDGPEQMHIIIVDNGRSLQLGDPEFQELLNCIRCGACLNACPVYRHIGGHAYGGTYSGPIGAVLTPALKANDVAGWDDIANASSLCGACYEACPVKIPLHDMLIYLRKRKVQANVTDLDERVGMKGFQVVMTNAKRFQGVLKLARLGQPLLARKGFIKARIGPLNGWNAYRHTPALPKQSFRERWDSLQQELQDQPQEMTESMRTRMKQALAKRGKEGHNHG
jgi:L-lactate dehydrogenase complex protein LldF